jgi:paraquat-inducible protein A
MTAEILGNSQTAAAQSLAICVDCHAVNHLDLVNCQRCGRKLVLRRLYSVQQCLALLVAALLFYIPANIFPIMSTVLLGNKTESTLIGGVLLFIEHGSYGIAFIIFTASVVIPIAKIAALLVLCIAATADNKLSKVELTRLYRVVEFVGKWSMVDVFVVAILVALVQVGSLMSIEPGIAITAFCTTVLLTMVAAEIFDTRLIWDRLKK